MKRPERQIQKRGEYFLASGYCLDTPPARNGEQYMKLRYILMSMIERYPGTSITRADILSACDQIGMILTGDNTPAKCLSYYLRDLKKEGLIVGQPVVVTKRRKATKCP